MLLTELGQTWCEHRNDAEFQAEATKLKPTESARVTYTANKLSELTCQVEAESGDWIVVDKNMALNPYPAADSPGWLDEMNIQRTVLPRISGSAQ